MWLPDRGRERRGALGEGARAPARRPSGVGWQGHARRHPRAGRGDLGTRPEPWSYRPAGAGSRPGRPDWARCQDHPVAGRAGDRRRATPPLRCRVARAPPSGFGGRSLGKGRARSAGGRIPRPAAVPSPPRPSLAAAKHSSPRNRTSSSRRRHSSSHGRS